MAAEHEPRQKSYDIYREAVRAKQSYPEKRLNSRLRKIVEAIPPGSSVLDVACGTGRVLHAVVAAGGRGRGIELAVPGVEAAQAKGLDVILGDVDSWEENPEVNDLLFSPYDVVIFSKCLMYLRTKNEIMARLKAKSVVVFQPNPGHLQSRWNGQAAAWLEWDKKLPYRLKGGEEIAIDGPAALAKWGASYGYVRSETLKGGFWSRSFIVKMSAEG